MKMLVSQKTRLIPNPPASEPHIRQHVRQPSFSYPNRRVLREDRTGLLFQPGSGSSRRTSQEDTRSALGAHPFQELSFRDVVRGGYPLCETSGDVWASSRRAFDSHSGWEDGWRHNVGECEGRPPDAGRRSILPLRHDLLSPSP